MNILRMKRESKLYAVPTVPIGSYELRLSSLQVQQHTAYLVYAVEGDGIAPNSKLLVPLPEGSALVRGV